LKQKCGKCYECQQKRWDSADFTAFAGEKLENVKFPASAVARMWQFRIFQARNQVLLVSI
jgi:hypothetical protein